MVRVVVPATTANLGPGYDCLGLALDLYNTVEIRPALAWKLTVAGEGAQELPVDKDNLVWRAMTRLWQETGTPEPRVEIALTNEIPLGRGLGSSAAAIVGGLVAANAWAGDVLTRHSLLQLAVELEGHPDNVAPALHGGLVISVMEGGRALAVPMEFSATLVLVACIPGFSLDTGLARQALPASVPHRDAVFNLSRTALLIAALAQGRENLLALASQDRLHQDYRKDLVPGFGNVVDAARSAGALACVLSGSGPSVLAVVRSAVRADEIGQAMTAAFAGAGISAEFKVLHPDLAGARIQQ